MNFNDKPPSKESTANAETADFEPRYDFYDKWRCGTLSQGSGSQMSLGHSIKLMADDSMSTGSKKSGKFSFKIVKGRVGGASSVSDALMKSGEVQSQGNDSEANVSQYDRRYDISHGCCPLKKYYKQEMCG